MNESQITLDEQMEEMVVRYLDKTLSDAEAQLFSKHLDALPALRMEVKRMEEFENFLDETLGHKDLDSISPNKLVDRIKAPIYLAAGREDTRAAPKHTEMMHAALLKAGKQSEMVIYDGEGHGNFLLKNQIDFYQRLLGFLDKHIGPGSQAK